MFEFAEDINEMTRFEILNQKVTQVMKMWILYEEIDLLY